MDQRGLVERAQRGDHDAFAELAGAAIARLDAAARLILRDHELARDAVQEAMVPTLDGDINDRTGIPTWVPQGATGGFWNDAIGGRGILVVTEVDGVTLSFEALTFTGGDLTVDRATLDTVRFLDALPTPPAG